MTIAMLLFLGAAVIGTGIPTIIDFANDWRHR